MSFPTELNGSIIALTDIEVDEIFFRRASANMNFYSI